MQEESTDYAPVKRKHQLIIAYSFQHQKYVFQDSDIKFLTDRMKSEFTKVKEAFERSRSLNPYKQTFVQTLVKFGLYIVFALLFLGFLYIWVGIFIFFLGDPVFTILYGYLVMWQIWWRGGRVGMEMIVEFRKTRPLEKYLRRLNQRYSGQWRLQFSVGGGGRWIQIDDLKRA